MEQRFDERVGVWVYLRLELSERTCRGQGKDSRVYTLVRDGVAKRLDLEG